MRRVRPFTVYRIRVQDSFQQLTPDDLGAFRTRFPTVFSGRSLGGHVLNHPVPCHIVDASKPAGNFAGFLPGSFAYRDDVRSTYRTSVISQVLWASAI